MGSVVRKGGATSIAARMVILARIVLEIRVRFVFTTIMWVTKGQLSKVDEWSSECTCSIYDEDHRWP